jgi:RNA polymerase sigma-70 factor (ECF subfamily)
MDQSTIPEALDLAGEPSTLAEWCEFHERITTLPDADRELFDLLLYQGLTQPEAANVLEIPLRTLKRRWQGAKLRLHEILRGEWPSHEVFAR